MNNLLNGHQDLPVLNWLTQKQQLNEFSSMDLHLARFVAEQLQQQKLGGINEPKSYDQTHDNLLIYLAALVSRNALRQHTCLFLQGVTDMVYTDDGQLAFELPDKAQWQNILTHNASLFCRNVNSGHVLTSPETTSSDFVTITPFVLYGDLFYMQRYFQYEMRLAQFIQNKTGASSSFSQITSEQLLSIVEPLFDNNEEIDWQKQAVINSIQQGFSIISGGPGTGKTTTVIKLLMALQNLNALKDANSTLHIQLVAPTGKAAQRLSESINHSKTALNISDETKQNIPEQALTIHRLLKPKGMNGFFHDANNPLFLDVLILDEASMVDISLMNRLIEALPPHAQVVLLGDQQQLASVEAGNVLADICACSPNYQVELQKSYRFDANSHIGQLANSIKQSDQHQALTILKQASDELTWFNVDNVQMAQTQFSQLIEMVVSHYLELHHSINEFDHTNGKQSFSALLTSLFERISQLQLLACVKQSEWGVDHLNHQVQSRLARRLKAVITKQHYAGRPIMISENSYHLGLYNGDIGIELIDPETNQLMAFFTDNTNINQNQLDTADNEKTQFNSLTGFKKIACQRLPEHQTSYAMTVHKSQGSEFKHAVLVLPDNPSLSGNVTKELLYTGLTRAKQKFSLYSSEYNLRSAIGKSTQRQSGLARMLKAGK